MDERVFYNFKLDDHVLNAFNVKIHIIQRNFLPSMMFFSFCMLYEHYLAYHSLINDFLSPPMTSSPPPLSSQMYVCY